MNAKTEIVKMDQFSRITLILMSVVITLSMLASGAPGDAISKVAAFCMLLLLIIALLAGKFRDLPRTVINPIVISISAYIVLYTISLFYATTGQFALAVFSYYLGGVAVFFLTVLLVNRELPAKRAPSNTQALPNTRALLSLLSFATAVAGIFSIDAASVQKLSIALKAVLSALLKNDEIQISGFEAGTRMTSIFGNANVFASLAALGTLAAAYLFLSAGRRSEKRFSIALLIVNAVSFLYCFSLGAMISMFFAIIIFIAFAGKEERPRVVYVILTTIVTSFLSVFAGFSGMGKNGAISLLPLLFLLVFGFVLAFLLRYIDSFAAKTAAWGKNRILILLVVLVILFVGGVGAAVTRSDSFTFEEESGDLRRAVSLEPGDYQLAVTMSAGKDGASLLIESQNYGQASTHTFTELYKGTLESAVPFSVPSDAKMAFIQITAAKGSVVDGITVLDKAGNMVKTVNPDYLLLPSFMANRLQGVLVNQNAAQRFVFFEDGLKIAARSPIIGHGPGAFESKVLEVQDYYYETKSPHNHYIQTLDEVGILGLIAFLAILIFSFAALVKRVRTAQNRALYSSLFAMLVMIVIHSAVELNFIYGVYSMAVYLILGLISSHYGQKEDVVAGSVAQASGKGGQALQKGGKNVKRPVAFNVIPKAPQRSALVFCLIVLLIYLGQFAGSTMAKNVAAGSSRDKFMNTLKTAAILDFTNDTSYKCSYLVAYTPDLPESYGITAEKYAEDVAKHRSFSSLAYLTDYYYKTAQLEKAYQTMNERQSLMRYDEQTWNATLDFYREQLTAAAGAEGGQAAQQLIIKYASAAYEQLEAYRKTSPLDIKLSEENQKFVEALK